MGRAAKNLHHNLISQGKDVGRSIDKSGMTGQMPVINSNVNVKNVPSNKSGKIRPGARHSKGIPTLPM